MERLAFADSFESEPKPANHTMLLQGFNAIVRAAGVEAAALPQPRADHFLVALDQQNHCLGWHVYKLFQHDLSTEEREVRKGAWNYSGLAPFAFFC